MSAASLDTVSAGGRERVRTFFRSLDRLDRRSLIGMFGVHRAAARGGFRASCSDSWCRSTTDLGGATRCSPSASACSRTPSVCGTPSTPTTSPRSTTRPASCWPTTRRRGTRPHAAVGRVLVLPRPLHDRVRAGVPALRRRQGAGRSGRGRRLGAALGHRHHRRLGLRRVPVDPRHPQPGRADRHRQGLPADAARRLRRGGAGGPAQQARLHEPVPRRADQVGPQAVAHLSGRRAVRARLRHRDRGRTARAGRRRGRVQPAVLRDPRAADPVRRGRCA